MQDLTREEAIAFNEHNNNSSNNNTTTTSTNNNKVQMCSTILMPKFHNQDQQLSHGLSSTLLRCIKLEADNEHHLEKETERERESDRWQTAGVNERLRLELNTTKLLLLQGSDDPLISHGASNDTHDEDQDHPFRTLMARKTEQQQSVHNGACSTLTKQQLKANLMNGRKIKKQPVEEPTVVPAQRTSQHRQPKSKKRTTSTGAIKLRFHHQALPAEYAAHYEATQGRQLSSQLAKPAPPVPPVKATPPPPSPSQNHSHENVRSWLRKIAEIQRNAERQQQAQAQGSSKESKPNRSATVATAPPTMTVLEPMAEVPNPKRSTIKYADLPYMGEITLDNYKPRRGRKPKKADICHLIYKNYGTIIPPTGTGTTTPTAAQQFPAAESKHSPAAQSVPGGSVQRSARRLANVAEEPLNLCMRDQSTDRYSISSGDSDKPSTGTTTECNSPFPRSTPLTDDHMPITSIPGEEKPRIAAKLLLKPMGLYYQQIMESCRLGLPVETIEKDNQLALKIPIPNGFFATSPQSTATVKRDQMEQPICTETVTPPAMSKRKRSAIFIPPMPADHSSSPSTEVSICKFKFTGGAKPTLQEKKMLSVDAEGNYRYYNGTGDRSMRGYEFISRDQQQPQQQQHGISVSGSSEKLYIDIPPPSTDLSLELLHIPSESPTSSLLMSSSLVPVAPQSPSSYSNSHSPMHLATPHPEDYHKRIESSDLLSSPTTQATTKRRSSRRSKQREKLEKTFKEKGFLIQTQQLQSAEGATYCKFRQLKKFTRYLFRNWKDHIPESDLDKHSGKDSDARVPHSVIENMLSGQIGLGLESLGANQAT
ncbi:uncharacterized protein LOC117787645 [Drosophila innubila]|uniref:uncharacterized protein LOC117787645 n=1 Tax=Drosophila innubila TaxID=198719 RepID=UPI00148C461F|nr:uncharacterized protein LOC117787645 [Drosophila innubila]XP_034482113.1 uncharacterized protein LOC117787645 [Drosophila innubila]